MIGTEAHANALSRAQTREDLLNSLRYRRLSGTLSKKPPSRVELLEEILSPWASISYGGCRFLRVARAETVRKLRAVNYYAEHCNDNLADTILNVEILKKQEEYVLFHLTMEESLFQPWSVVRAIPLCGWGDQPFRGLFVSITNTLERLRVKNFPTPSFIQEKIIKARAALKAEETLLGIMRAEVAAREARVDMLRSTLECAENKEWNPLLGFKTRIPPSSPEACLQEGEEESERERSPHEARQS